MTTTTTTTTPIISNSNPSSNSTAQTRKRKLTMAEEEEERQRSSRVATGCRRSSRQRNRIVTSPYRRMRQLFWTTTATGSTTNTDNNSNIAVNVTSNDDDDDDNNVPVADPNNVITKIGKFQLHRVYTSPNIYVIDNFLTTSELDYCDSLIRNASSQQKFEHSFVDGDNNNNNNDNDNDNGDDKNDDQRGMVERDQRTSSFVALSKLQSSQVASMERRAAEILGMSVGQIEPLQLVRYLPGEFFGTHHDMGILYDDGSVSLPPRSPYCKRRLATIFVYLNTIGHDDDDDDFYDNDGRDSTSSSSSSMRGGGGGGGCTYFPECKNLRVRPKRGRAVLFSNIMENGMPDPKVVHAGEAVAVAAPSSTTTTTMTMTEDHDVDSTHHQHQQQQNDTHGTVDNNNNNNVNNVNKFIKYGMNIWACEE